jgi:hypothetical protein
MPTQRFVRRGACTALLLAGCTTSASVPPSALAPGTATTAELTPAGQSAVAPMFGQRVVALEGRVVSRGDSLVRIAVTSVRRENGVSESWPSDQVTLPAGAVRSLRVRRLSVGRSVVLGGAAAVAMFLVGRNIGSSAGDETGRAGEPGGTGK